MLTSREHKPSRGPSHWSLIVGQRRWLHMARARRFSASLTGHLITDLTNVPTGEPEWTRALSWAEPDFAQTVIPMSGPSSAARPRFGECRQSIGGWVIDSYRPNRLFSRADRELPAVHPAQRLRLLAQIRSCPWLSSTVLPASSNRATCSIHLVSLRTFQRRRRRASRDRLLMDVRNIRIFELSQLRSNPAIVIPRPDANARARCDTMPPAILRSVRCRTPHAFSVRRPIAPLVRRMSAIAFQRNATYDAGKPWIVLATATARNCAAICVADAPVRHISNFHDELRRL